MQFHYDYEGETHQITLRDLGQGHYEAQIGVAQYPVELLPLPDGGFMLRLADRQIRVQALAQGEERFVHLDGQHYTLTHADKQRRRRGGGASTGDLSAQMPGQIRQVHVAEGDEVSAGQLLLVMEAMKMEMRISAPTDGRVIRLLVEAGDVVERGQRLIEMGTS